MKVGAALPHEQGAAYAIGGNFHTRRNGSEPASADAKTFTRAARLRATWAADGPWQMTTVCEH